MEDLHLARYHRTEHVTAVTAVRDALVGHPDLVSAELAVGTGLILTARRPT